MKVILTALVLLLSVNNFSRAQGALEGRVDGASCAPLQNGDNTQCVLAIATGKRNYAIAFENNSYASLSLSKLSKGDLVRFRSDLLEPLEKYSLFWFNLWQFNGDKYFPYKALVGLNQVVLSVQENTVSHVKHFYCEGRSSDRDYLVADVKFGGDLIAYRSGDYEISWSYMQVALNREGDLNIDGEPWYYYATDEMMLIESFNKKNYRPSVYKGFVKFPRLNFHFEFEGSADYVIPEIALVDETKMQFQSYMIFTSVRDHWGGTARLNCHFK